MHIIKKLKLKLTATKVILGIASIFGIVGLVGAASTFSWRNVENLVANKLLGQVPTSEEAPPERILGATPQNSASTVIEDNNGDQIAHVRVSFNTNTTTLNGNLTVASIADPFQQVTSTAAQNVGGVILSTDTGSATSYNYGYVGATSTVELVKVNVEGTAPTTTWMMQCSASADGYTTTSLAILKSDGNVPTSTVATIQSGMSSSTAYGATSFGSNVLDTATGYTASSITKILLTPTKPYLVCNIVQPYGTSLDTFYAANVTSSLREVLARISRTR